MTVRAHTSRKRHDDDGFTLLEVIVALTILGVSLTVLFAIFSQSLAVSHANAVRTEERALAHSLLLRATEQGSAIPRELIGRTNDGLVWRVHTSPFGTPEDQQSWSSKVTQVTVTVASNTSGRNALTLTTLRLDPKDPQ